jgi:hypothetical protein
MGLRSGLEALMDAVDHVVVDLADKRLNLVDASRKAIIHRMAGAASGLSDGKVEF